MMGEVTKSSIEHPAWFKDLYHQLLCTDLEPQLPGYSDEAPGPLDGDDVRKLVGYASVLSLESDGQRMAYEIVSRLVQGFGNQDPNLVAAADVVLSRIGNFPGRELLRRRFVSAPHSAPSLPGRLELERIAREVENTLEQPNGSLLSVTDFQFDFLELLDQRSRVSVSAPTSAGKSFVLGLDLIRRLQKRRQSSIAYLVPTRALIGEVAALLRAQLRAAGMGEVPLRTVPFPISKEEAPNGAAYVLTQERLNALLHSRQGEAWLTTLVVDEAQGIQDDARGITLQNAVEFVIGRFPQIEIFFASPLTSNPDYLLSLFGLLNDGYSLTNTVSPVSQNIVLVEQVHGQPSNLECTLLLDDEVVPLGKRTISFRFRGAAFQQRANLARAVTGPDEATILYANDADSAERLARALAGGMEQPANISEEVADFMEFVASEIHADYPLLDVLPHGIGFHYGSMPSLVRTGVEDLFRSGELRFLCCTSTLLQGVNLPARHIVMEKPTRGSGKPLKRRDFLNLAGRAGRLLQEFHGTIWCVRTKEWDEPAFQGTRLTEIRSAMSELMDDGGTAVQRLLDDVSSREESNVAEAALSRLYLDYVMEDRDIATSEFRTEDNAVQLEETARRCKAIEVDLPKSLLEANKSMRPDRLQSLYEYLSQTGDLEQMLPLKPGVPGCMLAWAKLSS
jgi:hypothetical protein